MVKKLLRKACLLLLFISAFLMLSITSNAEEPPPFSHVNKESWYSESAFYSFKYGYVNGTSDGLFSPDTNMTRAMAVKIFHSMSGDESEYTDNPFIDLKEGAWYHNSVLWAYNTSLTSGTGADRFSPDTNITRKEFATLTFNYYCSLFHDNSAAPTKLTVYDFTDYTNIPDYALEAFEWAVRYGIITGFPDSTLRPDALITRAEAVKIIHYFDVNFSHKFVTVEYRERSCTEDGHAVYKCSLCNTQREVDTKGYHLWDNWVQTIAPLCVSNGERGCSCSGCSLQKSEILPKRGYHTYGAYTIKSEPTCIKSGTQTAICTLCKHTDEKSIAPTGVHIYGDWTVTKKASRQTTGIESRCCKHCSDKKSRVYRDSSYYQIQNTVIIPSGGYNVSTDNIGLKVIYINKRLLGTTNASYTAETKNAVRNFQRNNGLSATGVVNLSTWLMMGYSQESWYSLASYVTPKRIGEYNTREECIEAMISVAKEYAQMGTVYRIGCSGKPGTYADCSGLIYQCLYAVGINPDTNIIDHGLAIYEYTSYYLAKDPKLGLSVPTDSMERGDLVFYANNGDSTVCHVGIYAGNGMIYDAWPYVGTTYRSVNIRGCHVVKAIRVFP